MCEIRFWHELITAAGEVEKVPEGETMYPPLACGVEDADAEAVGAGGCWVGGAVEEGGRESGRVW